MKRVPLGLGVVLVVIWCCVICCGFLCGELFGYAVIAWLPILLADWVDLGICDFCYEGFLFAKACVVQ